MKHAVIFDLDETLFDRRGSLRLFLADQFNRLIPSQIQNIDQAINVFLKLDNRGMTPKLDVYQALLESVGIDDNALTTTLFDDYEQNASQHARAFDGMDAMFEDLNALEVKTGIVSNGQTHIQLRSLQALGLDRKVDIYLISESEGLRKPEPEIYLRATRKLGVDPAHCIFVGDSPTADIAGASRVGMKTIWFPNGAKWPENLAPRPDAEIQSLSEVGAVIRDIFKTL
jgi:putative hydrolase of the HAD superfamily